MAETILEQDSADLYEKDMVKYSIIVNRRRAFPEIRDGLKPVQRRIIYDMYKQGATSFAKRIKSQAIVGDTMKLYHVHGDCVRGNTLLFGNDYSIHTIEELYESGITEFETIAVNTSTGPVRTQVVPVKAHSFRIGQYTNKIYHIVLSNGYDLQCTANHPILTATYGFVKAENLDITMRLHIKVLKNTANGNNLYGRPEINSRLLQSIVIDHYEGKPNPGYVRHHKDGNPFNNKIENLEIISRRDHVHHHYDVSDTYSKALEKGRESLKGVYKEKNTKKNKLLRQIIINHSALLKFRKAINEMRLRNIEVTYENYMKNEVGYYNLIRPETISEHYDVYGFENLVKFADEFSVSEEFNKIKPVKVFDYVGIDKTYYLVRSRMFDTLNFMFDNLIPFSYENFCYNWKWTQVSEEEYDNLYNEYCYKYPFIEDIWVEDVVNEPMYDFTVDTFENILIPTAPLPLPSDTVSCSPMICIHNSSIYSAIQPMAVWYKTKMPLITPKGNWGNLIGDGPAAARYTEAGLSEFGYDCIIGELSETRGVVDWIDNYNRTDIEPEYLPVKLPILLINGSFGIGVGMNTNIPTHNLVEVCEATRQLIHNPDMDIVLVPDHCQPCKIIADMKEIKNISKSGHGSYKLRGEVVHEVNSKGHPVLRILSLPDNVNTSMITNKLDAMMSNKELPMIMDIADATDSSGVNIIITLRKGADPNYVEQVLYTKTQVQSTISVNFEVVKGTEPGRFSYKQYLNDFLVERAMTKFRLYCNRLKDQTTRHHKLITYIKLIESGKIDQVYKKIRNHKSKDKSELVEWLIKELHITDLQAGFILDINFFKMTKGYYQQYKEELKALEPDMARNKAMITDDGTLIMNEIDKELLEIEKKYGSKRLCKLVSPKQESGIPQGIFKVVITRKNFIRKIPDSDKIGSVRGDDPKFVLRVDNTESILLFDNIGKVYKLPVHKIPVTDKQVSGTDIRILCKNLTADIISVFYEPVIKQIVEGKHKHYFAIVTKDNSIKKLDMEDFLNVNNSGLMYSKIKSGDLVTGIAIVPAELDVVVFSKQKALRTPLSKIPLFKRNASGSKAMSTKSPVEGISVIYPKTQYIVVITEKGRINKFNINALNPHDRGRTGINVIKLHPGDAISSIFGANDNDMIRIVTSENITEVSVNDVKERSPVAAGDKISGIKGTIIRSDIIWNN